MVIFDLYVIGGRRGFYAGQAKRMHTGGWRRRIDRHRSGCGSPLAKRLLAAGAHGRCIASIAAERGFVNLLEARLWDMLVVRGWRPIHPRPRESANWASCKGHLGRKHSLSARAKISRACRRAWRDRPVSVNHSSQTKSPAWRAKISVALTGRKKSLEARANHVAAMRRPEVRAKISAGNKQKRGHVMRSSEWRIRHAAAMRCPETRARMSAAQRRRYGR